MIIAGTGHRPHKLGNEYSNCGPYSTLITGQLKDLLQRAKATEVVCGLALGFDTLLALTALDLKIPVTAAVPFLGQEARWPKESQELYRNILANPLVTRHIVCEGGYAAWKMQVRNVWMVDRCNLLLGLWDGSEGGTLNCLTYADQKEKPTIILRLQRSAVGPALKIRARHMKHLQTA